MEWNWCATGCALVILKPLIGSSFMAWHPYARAGKAMLLRIMLQTVVMASYGTMPEATGSGGKMWPVPPRLPAGSHRDSTMEGGVGWGDNVEKRM